MVLVYILFSAAASLAAVVPLSARTEAVFDVKEVAMKTSPLDKQLISLSVEFGNAVDFFGDAGKPNLFSKRLLQNVVDRSYAPTILRIGGNTQDRAEFCATCNKTFETIVQDDPDDPKGSEAVKVTFNPRFFDVLTYNVPAGSPIIFGLNYRNDSLELAEAEIGAAFEYLDQSLVMAYELGNEPNLYGDYRPPTYGVNEYAADMRQWIPSLRALSPPGVHPRFQFPSFAGPQLFKPDMTIANLVGLGVPQSIGIDYFSVHGYPYDICTPESAAQVDLRNFLDHNKTLSLIASYGGEIAASRSQGKPLHMGETGSVACHGKFGVSNTLGAALWELDYALSGSTQGIDRFFFHMGKGDFYYSMWEPLPSERFPAPHINPTYYTMLFAADLVSDLPAPQIAPLTELDTTSTVHFAVYDGEELRKVVLLNLDFFNGTISANGTSATDATRPARQFDMGAALGRELRVRRLTGDDSAATDGVTWAGQSINGDGAVVGELRVEKITDGVVTLLASEAVIVERG
ncbi:hypothetical protein KVR01_012084 [Diaporthe batatas]|uniref:uncharacterized protein n=1 Tax=Diaporthe batatas TaxID=748121 RepID=UPI001D043AA3|nr:uncharacterized protein KVR01_012084 [Diaporthe batatas]KAG8158323.1 hypothetical protein KVR01_012084 [Diaporthe batatas]